MIKNLWKNTKFYCGVHSTPVEFQYQHGNVLNPNATMFYSCPKYYPDNRDATERACTNKLSFDDAEQIIRKLSDKIEEDEANGVLFNYTNYSFKHKTIEVKVLSYSDSKIKLSIINKKELK